MFSPQEIRNKIREFLDTSTFTIINNKDNSKVEYTPIKSCTAVLPVNVVSESILIKFVNYIIEDKKLRDLIDSSQLKSPPQENYE